MCRSQTSSFPGLSRDLHHQHILELSKNKRGGEIGTRVTDFTQTETGSYRSDSLGVGGRYSMTPRPARQSLRQSEKPRPAT